MLKNSFNVGYYKCVIYYTCKIVIIFCYNIFVLDDSSSDAEENIEDYDLRFARYKERVKAEEHFFYNSVDESAGSTNDSDD